MENDMFAWLAYVAVAFVLLLLLTVHVRYESDLLTKTRTNLSAYVKVKPLTDPPVDKEAERRLIRLRTRRAWVPYLLTANIWTLWMLFRIINSDSVLTYVTLCVACAAFIVCFVVYVTSLSSGHKLKQSHFEQCD